MGSGNRCSHRGECRGDYVAIGVTSITCSLIFFGNCFLWWKRRTPEVKAKQISLLVVQAFASILWSISLLTMKYSFRFGHIGPWFTCYLWQVWIGSTFSYCLVISCCVARAYRLYHVFVRLTSDWVDEIIPLLHQLEPVGFIDIGSYFLLRSSLSCLGILLSCLLVLLLAFVRRRLPFLRSRHLVPLLLLPSLCAATAIQCRRPFRQEKGDNREYRFCSGKAFWWLVIAGVHVGYISLLIVCTWLIRNIRFEFNESKELIASVFASGLYLGVWLALLFVGVYHKTKDRFEDTYHATSAYILVFLGSATALCFSFVPVLRPLKAYLGYLKKQNDFDSMGRALGVPNSSLIQPHWSFRFDEPLEALLQHKRFSQAFQAFADSRMAGESVRFYAEVRELNRMSSANTVARIYMAQHIIGTYVDIGSPLEINISHQMRSDILCTNDLSNPTLFDRPASEAIKIIQTNLEQDFWQSPYYQKLKEEMESEVEFAEQLEWMNISSKRDSFSTTDNIYEYKGSPGGPLKFESPSPPRNGASALSQSAAMPPEDLRLQVHQVANNMNLTLTPSPAFPNFQEALRNLSHHRPDSTTGGNH